MGFSFASVQLRITQNEAVVARSSRCCLSWQSLRPKPAQSPITMDTMDILLTVDTTDGVDITDTLTDTGGRDLPKNNNQNLNILSNDPLMLMPMPAPNPGTMDTTAIPTDGAVTTEDITDTVIPDITGVR